MALIGVTPPTIAGSVNANVGRPKFWARSLLIADRRSVTSAAPITLIVAVGFGFVKTSENIADTDCLAVMVTRQLPVPLQRRPIHPLKVAPGPGLAVSVTVIPLATSCEQVEGQEIPAGELATVPPADPRTLTESANCPGDAVNIAVMVVAVVSVTVQVP